MHKFREAKFRDAKGETFPEFGCQWRKRSGTCAGEEPQEPAQVLTQDHSLSARTQDYCRVPGLLLRGDAVTEDPCTMG